MPPKTKAVRLTRIDQWDATYYQDAAVLTNFDIPISAFSNGLFSIPAAWQTEPIDAYQHASYAWWGETLNTNGSPNNASVLLTYGYNYSPTNGWISLPFFDGRIQLKQNLIFQLRAAVADSPFLMQEFYTNRTVTTAYLYDYVYAGFYQFNDYVGETFNWLLPFVENYQYRNFTFNLSDLNAEGGLLALSNTGSFHIRGVREPARFQFQPPATNQAVIADLLDTNSAKWLDMGLQYFAEPPLPGGAYGENNYYEIALDVAENAPGTVKTMDGSISNLFGLPFVTAKLATGNILSKTATFSPGNSTTNDSYFYSEVGQPAFRTDGYIFFDPMTVVVPPGDDDFHPPTTTPLFLTSVGSSLSVIGYAKLEVTNSCYTGVYGYLGQYFDKAYKEDVSGNMTSTNTGIVSPYGTYFATEPGAAALLTMPDVDTGQRGTCEVFSVSLQLDKNHDGNMNLSFNGPDATTPSSPYVFWCNNNYDRSDWDYDDSTNYDDDVSGTSTAAISPFTHKPAPDYEYRDFTGARVIPTIRDLEDFSPLWVCGVTSHLLSALPTNSTITLSWDDVYFPNTNNPTIDLFVAADSPGLLDYLTNATTAAVQRTYSSTLYVGRLGPGQSIDLRSVGDRFIWCGVGTGSGELTLRISDGSGNLLARAKTYVQVTDIKQMYERWTVGDARDKLPTTNAILATDSLPTGVPAFRYTLPSDTNTPYIFVVHGWNDASWIKDGFAESAFKRLFWQGYTGRFGEFRWPTAHNFNPAKSLMDAVKDPRNYDESERQAWRSGAGLMNKFKDLNTDYPGNVYVQAHSMGNVVVGEALRLAAEQGTGKIVNTYVASQAAIPAHVYDSSVTTPYLIDYTHSSHSIPAPGHPKTPNIYGNRLTNTIAAVGHRVSFYNVHDYALSPDVWCFDQALKPDLYPTGTYGYLGSTNDSAPWNNFVFQFFGGSTVTLDIVTNLSNRYEVFALAANPYSDALAGC